MRKNLDKIFKKFSKENDIEAYQMLKKRWDINKLNYDMIKDKVILDVGSGSGRYSLALNKMGAKEVISIDIFKNERNFPKQIKYIKTNLSKLPFKDNTFDFIFCNGSLSHSLKWKKDILEYKRVLKSKGWMWLNLLGEGPHWKHADNLRHKLTKKDSENFQKALELRGWEANKIFFLLDVFFTDRIYLTKKKIKSYLLLAKFKNVKFLNRGYKTDLSELIFKNPKLKLKYGEGEIRLVCQK